MKLTRYPTAAAFLDATLSYLSADEVLNNLPIGIACRLRDGRPYSNIPPFLASIENAEDLQLICVMTPPHSPMVHSQNPRCLEALETLAQHFIASKIELPGILGPAEISQNFANIWTRLTGQNTSVRFDQGLYRLDSVADLPMPAGHGIVATPKHAQTIAEFSNAFQTELQLAHASPFTAKSVLPTILEGKHFLWISPEQEIVSACQNNRETPHGGVIGNVFTPPDQRGKGYATGVVTFASQILLSHGHDYCCLYTDLANPTSNRIYQKIGYRPIGKSKDIAFRNTD